MRRGSAPALLRCLGITLALGAACKGKTEVSFGVSIPNAVAESVRWIEIGAFRDTKCGALLPMLGGGMPDGATKRFAFGRDGSAAPRVGDLSRGSYAFAGVAKGEDCAVLATGCIEANLDDTDNVEIGLNAVEPPSGACSQGTSCQAARCVPTGGVDDPTMGVGCSLELLGAGPLANPIGGDGTLASAPAIAATPDGFVIVYRETDPNDTSARVTILPIDRGGGAMLPERPRIAGRCPNSEEIDGVGLAMKDRSGRIVLARPACGAKTGLEVLRFTANAPVPPENKSITLELPPKSADSEAKKLLLSASSVTGARANGDVLAFVEDGIARVSTLGPDLVARPSGTFGTTGTTGAWAASTDKVLALLAAGPADPSTPPPTDAGVEGGLEAGVDASTTPSTNTGPTLRLLMVPPTTALDSIIAPDKPRPVIAFAGELGAIAARGARVIVASDGGGLGRSVTFRTFDLNGTAPIDTDGFSVEGKEKVTAVDVAMQGDRAYFAALKQGQVAVAVYSNASTRPALLRQLSFTQEGRIPLAKIVRDGRVAIAATDTRVAVVWTTATTLTDNDATGGYAVFACGQ